MISAAKAKALTFLALQREKRVLPAQQDVEDHAATPDIALLVVFFLRIDNLRLHEERRA